MKTFFYNTLVFASIIQHFACYAQPTVRDPIEGTWKGTSLCQVKPSACHDENVVYHISKAATDNTYTIQMNKMVDGAEEEMGSIDAAYDKIKHTLVGKTKGEQGRNGVWLFIIDGKQMNGTLIINDNTLFRVIEIKKT